MTKTELFLKLAAPDKNGVSRWVYVSEFVGEYADLTFGNGASWARKESTLAKKYNVEPGTEEYKGFMLDNVLHSENEGDIHYNLYVPQSYDGSKSYALFLTLPGYQAFF